MCPNINITYTYKVLEYDNPMLAGSMGCYCSHLEVLNLIYKNKEKLSIVLEDDMNINEHFLPTINSIKGSLIDKKHPDIIYLGTTNKKPGIGRKLKTYRYIPFSNLRKLSSIVLGLYAYATSYEGARRIVESTIETDRQIDNKIYELVKNKKALENVYIVSDPITHYDSVVYKSQIATINNETH